MRKSKSKMSTVILQILDFVHAPAFKVPIFTSNLDFFELKKMIIIRRHCNLNVVTIIELIDPSSRCKLNVYIITHIKRNHPKQIDDFHKIKGNKKLKSEQNFIKNIYY